LHQPFRSQNCNRVWIIDYPESVFSTNGSKHKLETHIHLKSEKEAKRKGEKSQYTRNFEPMQLELTATPYRDAALPVDERVEDLISRMTVQEKAGLLFQDIVLMGSNGRLLSEPNDRFRVPRTSEQIGTKLMSHFNLLGPVNNVRETAEWHNRLQQCALETRLGIPVTLSSDPRNHFADNVGTGFEAGVLSKWPETLGLAALRSAELVERFANVAREEYLALGIRLALHPQIDLATEPRWSRIGRTFGEDANLSSELVAAYIRGFQGPELGPSSVSTMTKHFPGGGPQKEGEDPHFAYGKEQVYPGDNFEYHLKPFKAAIKAGTCQMMPCKISSFTMQGAFWAPFTLSSLISRCFRLRRPHWHQV
jgi:beta-glucosidase